MLLQTTLDYSLTLWVIKFNSNHTDLMHWYFQQYFILCLTGTGYGNQEKGITQSGYDDITWEELGYDDITWEESGYDDITWEGRQVERASQWAAFYGQSVSFE